MIDFSEIENRPDQKTYKQIEEFYKLIFENIDFDKFEKRISESVKLFTVLALKEDKIVGFKIGYEIAPKKFYSWIGGVDRDFRGQGIAAELMKRQHDWCVINGYDIIQTKTKNSFKSMLILNIKKGFDIVDVYKNTQGDLKIIMEKKLRKVL